VDYSGADEDAFLMECKSHSICWQNGDDATFHHYGSGAVSCHKHPGKLGKASSKFYKKEGYTIIDYPFYREVKRPAKPGEWVRVLESYKGSHRQPGIYQVYDVNGGDVWFAPDGTGFVSRKNYVVLEDCTQPAAAPRIIVSRRMLEELDACREGMDDFNKRFPSGEVEWNELIADHVQRVETGRWSWLMQRKERIEAMQGQEHPNPKGWSGKAVCVFTRDLTFTVGRVYTFDAGAVIDNSGHFYGTASKYYPFKTLDAFNDWCSFHKFIEYKGEQS
jgi:hypothetical protein